MDSKKVKLIIAGAIGLLAVIIVSITLFGGSGGDEIDQAALEELRNREEPIRGGPRTAPGGDDPEIPD